MTNWTSSDAKNYCNLAGISCTISGHGLVRSQSIKPLNVINKDSKLKLNLAKEEKNEKESTEEKQE